LDLFTQAITFYLCEVRKRKSSPRKVKSIDELTAGYGDFIKGKELEKNGKEFFFQVLKKAIRPTKSGSPSR